LGSEFYVASLPEAELAKIRLYLNFDMIASPNYVIATHDGGRYPHSHRPHLFTFYLDGSEFGIAGPPGSAEAEKLFHDYFNSVGSPSIASEFSGRSDYGPFLDVGIPSGGLDTGAEEIKTEEEATLFGGEAGVAYDINYHAAGDTVDNLGLHALELNSKAIAHAVATYATSFDSLPPKQASLRQKAPSPKYNFIRKGGVYIA
jgi:carboxypeptidase Q